MIGRRSPSNIPFHPPDVHSTPRETGRIGRRCSTHADPRSERYSGAEHRHRPRLPAGQAKSPKSAPHASTWHPQTCSTRHSPSDLFSRCGIPQTACPFNLPSRWHNRVALRHRLYNHVGSSHSSPPKPTPWRKLRTLESGNPAPSIPTARFNDPGIPSPDAEWVLSRSGSTLQCLTTTAVTNVSLLAFHHPNLRSLRILGRYSAPTGGFGGPHNLERLELRAWSFPSPSSRRSRVLSSTFASGPPTLRWVLNSYSPHLRGVTHCRTSKPSSEITGPS